MNTETASTPSKRRLILTAASRIMNTQGAARLTLEAVAAEAGVSKGGLLYHFPSKEALVIGMLNQLVEDFNARLEAHLTAEASGQPGDWLRAYIRMTFALPPEELELSAALTAAFAIDPALMEHVRQHFAAWHEQAIADGLPAEMATVVRLAVDGFWMAQFLGLAPPQGDLRDGVMQAMLRLTEPSAKED
jgi:AcrR family transcriptional regulator